MKTILVPTDFSECGNNAVLLAAGLAEKTGSTLILHHNIPSHSLFVHAGHEEDARKDVLRRINQAEKNFGQLLQNDFLHSVNVSHVITEGATGDEIVNEARRKQADLIVIGSRQNEGGDHVFIGSMLQKVMREGVPVCPVLAVNHSIVHCNWKNVLIPASFDHQFNKQLAKILSVFEGLNSTLHLLFVNTPEHFKPETEVMKAMEDCRASFPDWRFETHIYDAVDMEKGILEMADQIEADLIAMYTHRRTRKDTYNIGSAEAVTFRSQIPVLTVLYE